MEFNDGEWHKISCRGNVFVTKMPKTIDSLLNKDVVIQGHTYTVIGVETFALSDPTLYIGRPVGLLVRGEVKKWLRSG